MDGQSQIPVSFSIPMPFGVEELSDALKEMRSLAGEIRQGLEIINAAGIGKISYSEEEAAELLEIAKTTLQKYRNEGKISYTPVGGKFRYTREHIENFIKTNQQLCKKDKRK